jgi:membrane protease subunit HflK
MSEHEHHDHEHAEETSKAPVPLMPDDAGSKALSDALSSSFWIVKILMVALVGFFFLSGMFTVGPQQRAVLLRFGKPVGQGEKALLGPGFHWAFPAPIDSVVKIPFSEVQSADSTVGWYAVTAAQEATGAVPPPRDTLDPAHESYLLTGDANIIHARAKLRYRITDPNRYIFAFTNAAVAVTNALNNALYFAAAQFNVDDALTRSQIALRERIERRVDSIATQQRLGITIEQVTLTVSAPRWLAEKFRAASEAAVRSERVMSQAQAYENEAMAKAGGEAASRRGIAESDRTRLVEAVAAEAKFFSDVLPRYRANPELFMRTLQAEAVQKVFNNAQDPWFRPAYMQDRLDVSRQPLKPKPAPEAPKDEH